MGKTGLKESASAAKPAKIAKKAPKGAVTESKTFRDGLIYLYQRADFKKPTWLCRVKVPNGSGYVNRSTGTGDEHKAFKFADDLYNQLLVKSLTGEAPPAKRMGPAIQAYIDRLSVQYLGENRSGIAFRVGTVDVTRISAPVTAPINLTGAQGFGLVSRLLLSPGLLCEDNNIDSSALNCGYQLGAKLVANDNKGSFYADYRWESVGAMRRSLLGLGYAYRFGPKNGLEVSVEANRGLTGGLGRDNRAMVSLRVAQ